MDWKTAWLAAALALGGMTMAQAADDAAANAGKLNRQEAKQLKAQSEGEYKARGKVAEGNEALDKADCEALSGSAQRACKKDAKAAAKSDKAHAKAIHESEEEQIKAMKK